MTDNEYRRNLVKSYYYGGKPKQADKREYLRPIDLSGHVWCYVERRGLRVVVQWPNKDANQFLVTWKRLDRLRKQAMRDKK